MKGWVTSFLGRPCGLFLLFFALSWATHGNAIHDPPYWDTLTGAFAQGHWQAVHSFSPFALLERSAGFNDGGACVYPFSVYPPLVGAFERFGVSVQATLVALHVLSFAAGAVVLTVLFCLAREALGVALAALATIAVLALPLFRALLMQVNMDILLAAFTLLALLAVTRRQHLRSVLWAACALLTKPTGVIVVVALAVMLGLRRIRPTWFGAEVKQQGRLGFALAGLGLLFALFVAELLVIAAHGKSPPGVSLFGGTLPFLGKRLWTLPEFGLSLFALACLVPWIVKRTMAGTGRTIEIDGLVFTAAFVGFYCQYDNVLPRYFVQAFPVVILVLTTALAAHVPKVFVGGALVLFAVFGVVNARGRFHPTKFADWSVPGEAQALVTNDGWLLERSLAYRDDLALNRAIASYCETLTDRVVVAGWPLLQLLSEPRLGYLTTPPRLAAAETPIQWTSARSESAGRSEDRSNFVRLVSPNVYASETSRVLQNDRILETFTRGRSRAFLVERPSDSHPDRR